LLFQNLPHPRSRDLRLPRYKSLEIAPELSMLAR